MPSMYPIINFNFQKTILNFILLSIIQYIENMLNILMQIVDKF